MTIKAILRDGRIQPLEPLPPDWTDGQELVIEDPEVAAAEGQLDQWAKELQTNTSRLPAEEHDRFRGALTDVERESKDAIRREWGLS
jgi:hypothetical protein